MAVYTGTLTLQQQTLIRDTIGHLLEIPPIPVGYEAPVWKQAWQQGVTLIFHDEQYHILFPPRSMVVLPPTIKNWIKRITCALDPLHLNTLPFEVADRPTFGEVHDFVVWALIESVDNPDFVPLYLPILAADYRAMRVGMLAANALSYKALYPTAAQLFMILVTALRDYSITGYTFGSINQLSLPMLQFLSALLMDGPSNRQEAIILNELFVMALRQNTVEAVIFERNYLQFITQYKDALILRGYELHWIIGTFLNTDPKIPKPNDFSALVARNHGALAQSLSKEDFCKGTTNNHTLSNALNQYPIAQWSIIFHRNRNLQQQFNQCFASVDRMLAFLAGLSAGMRLNFLQNYWFRQRFLREIYRPTQMLGLRYARYTTPRLESSYSACARNAGKFFSVIKHDPLDELLCIRDIPQLFDLDSVFSLYIILSHIPEADHLLFLRWTKISSTFERIIVETSDLDFLLSALESSKRFKLLAGHPHLLSLFKQVKAKTLGRNENFLSIEDADLNELKTILQVLDEAYAHPKDDRLSIENLQLYRQVLAKISRLTPPLPIGNFGVELCRISEKERIPYLINDAARLDNFLDHIRNGFVGICSLLSPQHATQKQRQDLYDAMRVGYTLPPLLAPPQLTHSQHSQSHYLRLRFFSAPPPPASSPQNEERFDYRYEIYHAPHHALFRRLELWVERDKLTQILQQSPTKNF